MGGPAGPAAGRAALLQLWPEKRARQTFKSLLRAKVSISISISISLASILRKADVG